MNTGSEHPAERLTSVHSKSTIKSMLNIGCSAAQLHDSQRLLFLFLFIIFLFQVLGLFWGNGLWMGNINSLITVCFAFLATRKQLFKKKKSEIILKLKQAALFLSMYWFPRWFWNANRNFKHHEIWVLSQTLLGKLLSLHCLNKEVHRKRASWKISGKMAKKSALYQQFKM